MSIASRIEPGDTVVEAVLDYAPFVDGRVDPEEELRGSTRTSDAVAVLRVGKKESRFTLSEDWIMSRVTADVQSVLKDTTGRLVEGGLITIHETGGELVLDGQRIIARFERIRSTEIGRTYVVPTSPSWTSQMMVGCT
ncbi:MAG TPA: hypothetical protein VMO26_24905 [Vicinamibacterales bacterium]|nr:hypothetical protein [Vicinamibacterales bacterium]